MFHFMMHRVIIIPTESKDYVIVLFIYLSVRWFRWLKQLWTDWDEIFMIHSCRANSAMIILGPLLPKMMPQSIEVFGRRFNNGWQCSRATNFSMITHQDQEKGLGVKSTPTPKGVGPPRLKICNTRDLYAPAVVARASKFGSVTTWPNEEF